MIYKVKNPSSYSIFQTFSLNVVVVKVNEDTIDVIEKEENRAYHNLYKINLGEKRNIGFEQGQEVMIYHKQRYMSGMAYSTINKVKKIEIINNKSEMEIPKDVLRYYYSLIENVSIDVEEITKNSILLRIKDLNEIPFEYSKTYSLCKSEGGQEITISESKDEGKFYSITNGDEIKLTYSWNDKNDELKERKI